MYRSLVLPLLLILPGMLHSQTPEVLQVSPPNQDLDASRNTAVTVRFDMPMDPASVNDTTFQVFGRWSGVARGAVTFSGDSTLMTFQTEHPFFAGEWVSVQLSRHIRSARGEDLSQGYAWGFWIACAQGTLHQVHVETIVLREPGEGLIQTYGAHAGDLDADGMSDLIMINETSDDLRISLNDGSGRYQNIEIIAMGNSRPSPNDGGDFNKDGHLDLAIGSVSDDVLRVCYGDGTGSFNRIDEYSAGNAVRAVATGDFNGDGWDDIATANRSASNATVFINQGDSTFSQTSFEAGGNGETSCVATDANGDGILDLFIGMYHTQEICLLLGAGDGTFELSDCAPVTGGPWMIASGDMNGDGHADVVSANLNGDAVVVVLSDGEGGLGEETPYFFGAHAGPLAIDLGDLDADGDLDAVASYYSSQSYVVFDNDGSGTFDIGEALSPAESTTARSSCAILHDRDNDGDLDITLTDEGDDVVYLFENDPKVASRDLARTVFNITIAPNPVERDISILFTLTSSQRLRIEMRNPGGALVQVVSDQNFGPGSHSLAWNAADLATGVYFLTLESTGHFSAHKLVVP